MPSTKELGSTGIQWSGGWVFDQVLSELTQRRKYREFRQIATVEPYTNASIWAILLAAQTVEWSYEGDNADRLEEEIAAMGSSWRDLVSDTLYDLIVYGFVVKEIVYQRTERGWGWKRFATRVPDTILQWERDDNGEPTAAIQWLYGTSAPKKMGQITLPLERCLHIVSTTRRGDPEGESSLYAAYKPYKYKTGLEEVRAVGSERHMSGLPVLKVPGKDIADTAKYAKHKRLVRNIRVDEKEGIVIPSDTNKDKLPFYTLELLSSQSRMSSDLNDAINTYALQLCLILGTDWLLVGHEETGSFALSVSKIRAFAHRVDAWLNKFVTAFNEQAVARWGIFNGIPPQSRPELVAAKVNVVDIGQIIEYVKALTQAGSPIALDPNIDDHLRAKLGLPESDGGGFPMEPMAEPEEETETPEQE